MTARLARVGAHHQSTACPCSLNAAVESGPSVRSRLRIAFATGAWSVRIPLSISARLRCQVTR